MGELDDEVKNSLLLSFCSRSVREEVVHTESGCEDLGDTSKGDGRCWLKGYSIVEKDVKDVRERTEKRREKRTDDGA